MASNDQPMPTVGEKRSQPEGDVPSNERVRQRGPFLRPLDAQGMSDRARILQELDRTTLISLRTLAFGPGNETVADDLCPRPCTQQLQLASKRVHRSLRGRPLKEAPLHAE
jgi:hypothetical protein